MVGGGDHVYLKFLVNRPPFRVCNIRPLFQIRIFGYFSRQIRISGFYPDFFAQVLIGPESKDSLSQEVGHSDSEDKTGGLGTGVTTNKHTEALHSSTSDDLSPEEQCRKERAQHWTINAYYSVIQCMYTYTEATVLSPRLTSCKPYVLRKRTCPTQINFVVVRTYICTLYFCEVLCYVFILC